VSGVEKKRLEGVGELGIGGLGFCLYTVEEIGCVSWDDGEVVVESFASWRDVQTQELGEE